MTRLIVAAAILGLSVGSAAAECNWQHSAEAKAQTDPTITASVATEPTNMSTEATPAAQIPRPAEDQ